MRVHLIALAMIATAHVANADEQRKPPVEGSRVAGGIAIGSFVGVGGGIIGGLIAAGFSNDACSGDDDECHLRVIAIGAVPGITLGAATGAWIVGTGNEQTSSYVAALGGAAIGAVGAYGGSQATRNPYLEAAMFVLVPAVGATVGVALTREYRTVVIEPRVTATPDHALLGIGGTF